VNIPDIDDVKKWIKFFQELEFKYRIGVGALVLGSLIVLVITYYGPLQTLKKENKEL
jgi:hypothetical protein